MSLLSIERYRTLTHDNTSASGVVGEAIDDAIGELIEELRRPIELAERTEDVTICEDGRVYPIVWPITAVVGGYEFDEISVIFTDTPAYGDMPIDIGGSPTITRLTYTAGWTADTLPVGVQRAIAEIAYNLTRSAPAIAAEFQNASSIRNGDVAIGFGKGGVGAGSATGRVDGDAVAKAKKRYGRRDE